MKKIIKKYAADIAKKNIYMRRMMRKMINVWRIIKYQIHIRGISVQENTVVFNAFNGKSYTCTPRAVYEYMQTQKEYENYQFIWVVRDMEKYKWLAKNSNTRLVKDRSRQYEKALASARYWICNYRIYDYIYPKKNQVYVQCWHGTPLKRLGYDIEHSENVMNSLEEIQDKYRTDAEKFTYILSPSLFASEKFASAWNLNKTRQTEKLIQLGYPRNDYLYTYDQEDAMYTKKSLGIENNKKVLLYAPTWRDNQHASGVGYVYSSEMDFNRMQQKLGEDWIILFRSHYLVANSFDFERYKGFVYDVSGYDDISRLYVIADMLVTDYSSVFFDYANLCRPMVFFMYDLKLYENDLRGFYLDLEELPGPIVETQEELMQKVLTVDSWFTYDEKYEKFNQKYNALNDGKATSRFVKRVFGSTSLS